MPLDGTLRYVLSRVTVSLYLNMFGYGDQELNDILMAKALDAKITMLITLDKSQTGTKTEAALIAADKANNLSAFNTHFVVGNSRRARSATPRALLPMAEWPPKARRTGRFLVKASSY